MTSLGRVAGAVLVTALATAGSVVVAAPASAHDVLLRTDPADGASVARVPDRVVLTFDRPALGLGTALEVIGPSGNVASGAPVLIDTTVTQPVRTGSPAGSYIVRWRVTSADGHPVSGSFGFTALGAGAAATTSASAGPASSAGPGSGASAGTTGTGGAGAAGTSLLWWGAAAALAVLAGVLLVTVVRRRGVLRETTTDPAGGDDG